MTGTRTRGAVRTPRVPKAKTEMSEAVELAREEAAEAAARKAAAAKKLEPHLAGATSLLELAAVIVRENGGRMNVTELSKAVVATGRSGLKGKTPEATVGARVYVAAKKGHLFRKVDGERGVVELLPVAS